MTIPKPLAYAFLTIPWVLAGSAAVWLALLRFPPSGIFQTSAILDGGSPWINPFLPGERASKPGLQPEGWVGQRITDDPVYFSALVPGPYESVEVSLEYRPMNQPLLEFGLVHDPEGKMLEMHPLYSSQLENGEWIKGSASGREGYVRRGVPATRLADQDTQGLAVWNSSSTSPSMQDETGPERDWTLSLRGSHDFFFVPTADLDVTFSLQAANRSVNEDLAAFRVFCADEEIKQDAFSISGSQDRRMGKTITHAIRVPQAKSCVYRISFVASDDVFIRGIKTTSRRWVVGPRLVFGDVVGFATTTYEGLAYTNSRHIVLETFHKEGLQQIFFGDSSSWLKRTHSTIRMDRGDGKKTVQLRAPQGDVRIVGDGYFAFSEDAFFEPKPRRMTDSTDLKAENTEAVLTDYGQPEKLDGDWLRSDFRFALNPTMDRLRFVLSAPGVLTRSAAVDVRRATLTFRRQAINLEDWWFIIRQELANAWHRL
ncbi:hypothetical protein HZC53_06285 [Candidatus Uhrbacteria bacterium]|nr:hypothetical protein [Candidatus Uhrbacteria bacterium]